MGKKRIQTRVAQDTKRRIEEYQDDREINQSDAIRRLIHAGLASEGYPVTATDGGLQETAMQWADRSFYATFLLALGAILTATFNAPIGFLYLGLAAGTTASTGLISIAAWFALELHTDSDVTTTTEDAA